MLQSYLKKILSARVYEVAIESPLDAMPNLSKRLGCEVRLKREDEQPVFSFKLRGAYNKIAQEKAKHGITKVITASAGNHAQGVALSAAKLGLQATIVMPEITPRIKINAVRARGGHVVLHGDNFDVANAHAQALAAADEQLAFIPPFDDPEVIAGQGTIGMELVKQVDDVDKLYAVFIPIGGGGLAAGIGAYLKAVFPHVKIIGVEPAEAANMDTALKANERVVLPYVSIFADGVAVKQAGEETFRVCKEVIDEMVLCSTDEICAAIKDIFDDTRAIAEPAGGLAVAGMKAYCAANALPEDAIVIAINSGANMNFDRLRHVAERAEIGEQREAIFAVTIPETPGSFLKFCSVLGKRQITEFNYRYVDSSQAHIYCGIGLSYGLEEKQRLIELMEEADLPVIDLSDNEVAKVHTRYMVGGHGVGVKGEVVYRFEFPERPGALLDFLTAIGQQWNISLFHYRNHGADYGRVLVGIQVPEKDRRNLHEKFAALGENYRFTNESDNPAYQLFLQAEA